MKTKSMVLIMIALVCGLIASIGISQVMEQGKTTQEAPPTEPIFVALAHIDIGDALDSSNVKLEQWPRDRVPEGAIQNLEKLEARFARQRLYPGEPILDVKLMDSNAGDNSSKIPEGYRVSSIKVTMDTSVSNLIKPGDRVDLIAFFRRNNEINFTGARTILRDVRVFAINAETERAIDKDGQVSSAKTVSLLVKPHQVEMVTLAGHLGKLQLSLRRPDDQSTESYGEITIEDLLNSKNEVADDPEKKQPAGTAVTSDEQDFLEFLKRNNTRNELAVAQPPPPTKEPVVAQPSYAHTMTVLTPEGAVQYQWQDENALPQTGSLPTGQPVGLRPTAPTPPAGLTPALDANFKDSEGNDLRNGVDFAESTEGSPFEGTLTDEEFEDE